MIENNSLSAPGLSKGRIITYWVCNALVAFELIFGASWDFNLVNTGYVPKIMQHLGYPAYFAYILGACKLPAAAALLVPGWPRLKEWAYAGTFFIFGGAVASHAFSGDGLKVLFFPAVYAGLTLLSWAFRPPSRKF